MQIDTMEFRTRDGVYTVTLMSTGYVTYTKRDTRTLWQKFTDLFKG